MPPAHIGDLETVFASVVSVSLNLVGVGLLIMLLYGGLQFVLAGGDKESAQRARRTLTYAVMGLVLAISSWTILNFVGYITGLDLSVFSICLPGFRGPNCT